MKESEQYEQMETDDIPNENKQSKYEKKHLIITIIIAFFLFLGIFLYIQKSEKGINSKDRRVVILGIGPVSKSLIPILDEKIKFKEYIIYDKVYDPTIKNLVKSGTKINVIQKEFNSKNIEKELTPLLRENDLIIDIFSMHSTLDVIKSVSKIKNSIYINAGVEETDSTLGVCENIKKIYTYKNKVNLSQTIAIGCGANPGMITHFVKLGLINMAKDAIAKNVKNFQKLEKILEKGGNFEADLAEELQVEVVHISELETNDVNDEKEVEDYATNTWSIETFIEECVIDGEIALNDEDIRYFNKNNQIYEKNKNFELMYSVPAKTYIKTASPFGIFTGKVTSHEEVIEISELLSNERHKITAAFVYHPSRLGRKTLKYNQDKPRKVFNEENCGPLKGFEIMGATLISKRKDIPARWYGSVVSCEESRNVGCTMNPTTLQVVAGLYSHINYALDNTNLGIVFPHDFNSVKIMEIAKPYLGNIYDINLPFNISYKWEDLISNEQEMNYDI